MGAKIEMIIQKQYTPSTDLGRAVNLMTCHSVIQIQFKKSYSVFKRYIAMLILKGIKPQCKDFTKKMRNTRDDDGLLIAYWHWLTDLLAYWLTDALGQVDQTLGSISTNSHKLEGEKNLFIDGSGCLYIQFQGSIYSTSDL